jgi:DNA-binding LytR/AlgR family response regulator
MNIEILIIEDELPARRKLNRYLEQLEEKNKVVAECATVEEAILFFENGGKADLILSDIALQDGNAFDIYQEIALKSPVIFTTAYDAHMLEAFESNGIAYLMKPFTFERFEKAWKKFLMLRRPEVESITLPSATYKSRIVINTAKDSYLLEVASIAYFLAEEGVVKAIDRGGKSHLMGLTTLKDIASELDPGAFFRINRSELVSKTAIQRMERYGKNSLAIQVQGSAHKLVTSQSNTAAFREWVEQ